MSMKASQVGEWFRKCAGKRDHHELMPEDYVVIRPGPNFHLLMGKSQRSWRALRCLVLRSGSGAVIIGWRLSKCRRERVRPCWTALAHEPVEVRSRPQHDVILRHEFVVVALAGALSKPRADLARFDPHRFLLGRPVSNALHPDLRFAPRHKQREQLNSRHSRHLCLLGGERKS